MHSCVSFALFATSPRASTSTHPVTPATSARTMALSYDLAMQGYFTLYASTMTTFPDQCVTGAPAVGRAAGIANAFAFPRIAAIPETRARSRPPRATARLTSPPNPRLRRRIWGPRPLSRTGRYARPRVDPSGLLRAHGRPVLRPHDARPHALRRLRRRVNQAGGRVPRHQPRPVRVPRHPARGRRLAEVGLADSVRRERPPRPLGRALPRPPRRRRQAQEVDPRQEGQVKLETAGFFFNDAETRTRRTKGA